LSSEEWQEWVLETHSHHVELLEDWFFAQGALAVSLEDNADEPLLEPGPGETPVWQNVKVTALFAGDVDLEPIRAEIPDALLAKNSRSDITTLRDRAWERVWMDDFSPIQMGPRLWICPSWSEPPDASAINVYLDPGLAFGTGTHATTAMCLAALDDAVRGGERVVDYGCGSGILAIAALRLGASSALGVDNDPQALTASRDNAERNQIEASSLEILFPESPGIDAWVGGSDLVVANILAGPLLTLADELIALMTPGAKLLLTGILTEQAPELIERYATVNLQVSDTRDGWVLMSGQRAR
jgi:ribosomal protein L11 methyltransferase